MHAIVGILAGPFLIIATLTGCLYGLSFATENWVYRDSLFVTSDEQYHSIADQLEAARSRIVDDSVLVVVRPAANSQETTRVLYTNRNFKSSEFRTLFIDPNTLSIKGDMITYGSSGAMPLRTTIDYLHRDLLLGQLGRWYSELAASWLWLLGLSGIILFIKRLQTTKIQSKNSFQKLVNFHAFLGVFCLLGIVMFSITGLTWSEWAGDNISKIRSTFNWMTPSVQRAIPSVVVSTYDFSMFDQVVDVARKNGIIAKRLEIRPGKEGQEAWLVSEIEKTFPTKNDAVGINPSTLEVSSRIKFQDFPLMAKLTRWGIDLHMGSLFGFWNQILLIILTLMMLVLIITGYVMWIKRKGWKTMKGEGESLVDEFLIQPSGNKILISILTLSIGAVLPVFLVSLIGFSIIEKMIKAKRLHPSG